MKNKIIILVVLIFSSVITIAQQIPVGSCGFVYIHDDAGNRLKRIYFCNNGIDPYPSIINPAQKDTNVYARNISKVENTSATRDIFKSDNLTEKELKNATFQPVDALYPNPTTGIFFITFSKPLEKATINILDLNGKVIKTYIANGDKLTCDLSEFATGNYFVRITDKTGIITKKIIKQ